VIITVTTAVAITNLKIAAAAAAVAAATINPREAISNPQEVRIPHHQVEETMGAAEVSVHVH
jgi:hypothetical protein